MKKLMITACTAFVAAVMLMSAGKKDGVITKENGMSVVNTTTLTKDVEGYNGPVPVKIYIKKNKVDHVELLPSQEGPKYVAKVKKALLDKWNGLTVKAAATQQVDAATGATYTSNAVIKNVQRGLEYYQNKK